MAVMAKLLMLLPVLARGYDVDHDWDPDWDGCTSIIVGSGATVDGSALTSHSNDCADCDWRMAYVPARDYPEGALRKIYDGKTGQYPRIIDPERSSIYQPGAGINKTAVTGAIPQARHTHAMWESSYSLINEKGLALGESTCSANLVGRSVLDGGNAIFAIRQLMAIALERCETARCAVQTMGDLAARYGFYGEDPGKGGAGESVQAVDASGEAWVFHVTGGLNGTAGASARWANQRGALWAAQKVPKDHVAVVANNFIIRQVDPADTENFLVHPGLFELAQEAGLWDGQGKFDFMRIMAPDIRFFSYNPLLPPIPMYTTIRQWWVFRSVAPKAGYGITEDPAEYPFSVKVEKKVSLLEVMDLFRTHYEGTEFDMRLGAMAGPFQSPNRVEGGRGMGAVVGQYARSPSIQRTAYTQVCQSGPRVEPAVWYAPDCSAASVFVPFFARALEGPDAGKYDVAAYGEGSMKSFSFTEGMPPAWWAHDFVANWMELSYQNMSEHYVYPKVQQLQKEVAARAQAVVAAAAASSEPGRAAAMLAAEQTRIQRHVTEEWWKFAGMLVVRYNDYFFNFGEKAPQQVATIGYPAFWLEMVGFDRQSYFPTWFSKTPLLPQLLPAPEKALAALSQEGGSIEFGPLAAKPPSAGAGAAAPAGLSAAALVAAAVGVATVFAAGVAVGHGVGRRSAAAEAGPSRYHKIDC